MKKIGDMLGRFSVIAQDSDLAREVVCEALKDVGIIVAKQSISIKGSFVKINLSPVQKSQLFLKKNLILQILAQNPLTKKIKNIY